MSEKNASARSTKRAASYSFVMLLGMGGAFALAHAALPELMSVSYVQTVAQATETDLPPAIPPLDEHAYDTKLLALAGVATSSAWYSAFLHPTASTSASTTSELWPVRTAYPRDSRALLPFNRIVAYYGNFYSTAMGALGEYEPAEMLERLKAAVAEWEAADPTTPVIPAIHYIAIVAQAGEGRDGKYRARMPDEEIEKALKLAEEINGIVFLDLQVGLSDIEGEVAVYEEYLKLPQVHLGLDPEFSMQTSGYPPGHVIGTYDAADINYAAEYLAKLVREHDLPPKVLVIHRFTQKMLTNYDEIKPLPEVQIVMDMDGWGSPARKKNTYYQVIEPEPVQFTGFKLFYKNDLKEDPPRLLTPQEVLELTPAPIYIQYQ